MSIMKIPASEYPEFLKKNEKHFYNLANISTSPSSVVYLMRITESSELVKLGYDMSILNIVKYYDGETPILKIHYTNAVLLPNVLSQYILQMLTHCENDNAASAACIYMKADVGTEEYTVLKRINFPAQGWKALQKGYTPSNQLQKYWSENIDPPQAPLSAYAPIAPTDALFAKAILESFIIQSNMIKTFKSIINVKLGEFEISLTFLINKLSFTNPLKLEVTVRSIRDNIRLELSEYDGKPIINVFPFAFKPPTDTVLKKQIQKAADFLAFCLLGISRYKNVQNAIDSKNVVNTNNLDFNIIFRGIQKAELTPLPLHTVWPKSCRLYLPVKATWSSPVPAMSPFNLMPKTLQEAGNLMSIICGFCEDDETEIARERNRDVWVNSECSICDTAFHAISADGTVVGKVSFVESDSVTIFCMWTLRRSKVPGNTIAHELLRALENYARETKAAYIRVLPLLPKRRIFEGVFAYINNYDIGGDTMFKTITETPTLHAIKHALVYSPDSTIALTSIQKWTTDAYFLFNRALRQGALTQRHIDIYKGILKYFEKHAIEMPIDANDLKNIYNMKRTTLYRGVHPLDREDASLDVLDELFPTGIMKLEDKGFMALSKIENVSEEFACKGRGKGLLMVFDINEFPDKCLIDIEPVSTLGEEYELLALPGSIELTEKIGSRRFGNREYTIYKAKYTPTTPMSLDEAERMAKANTVVNTYDGPPLIPGQSALKPGLTAGGGSVESYIARLFTEKLPNAHKFDVTNKLAVFYNYNPASRKFQILRVLIVKKGIFLPDEIAELDAKQAKLPEIRAVWQALEDSKRNKKLASRLTAQAMLTNVSIAIFDATAGIVDWRYGDIYELPARYRPALFEAIKDAAAP
jgi:hypothetical protein